MRAIPRFLAPSILKSSQRGKFAPEPISGLGSAVLLPEFKARSGTIHTARFAWLQNKKIFCFNNDSSGVQKVLASGNAFIFNSTEDLIKRIGE